MLLMRLYGSHQSPKNTICGIHGIGLKNFFSKVQWFRLVWFRAAISKQSFICWLAMLNRLSTRMRQHKHDSSISLNCIFCGLVETREHLFFYCVFSSHVWRSTKLSIGKAYNGVSSWQQVVERGLKL